MEQKVTAGEIPTQMQTNLPQTRISLAPRNKNVWSAKVPPTNFRDASNPANTTDCVPCIKQKKGIISNLKYK